MKKSQFTVLFHKHQWKTTSDLQELILPFVYDIGEELDVREVHLVPESHTIAVCGRYRGASTIVRINRGDDPASFIAWVEMFVACLSDEIPESGAEECERRAGNDALRFVLNDRQLVIGGNFSDIGDSTRLRVALEAVYSRQQEACAVFEEGGSPAITQLMDDLDAATLKNETAIN